MSRPYHAKSFGKFDTIFFQEIILSSGVFRRETASGFYPWGNVDPRCSKAVFMFFVFDSIHDSAKLPIWRNLSNFVAKIHNHEVKTDEDRTNRFGQSPRDVSTDGRCYRPLVPTDMP